jgi:hypothetical protein
VQWGAPIGKHAAIADKIANIASTTFAIESMTLLTSALVDRKKTDIRVEAAMAKMYGTEAAWKMVDDAMQVLGGRGYETADSLRARGERPVYIERAMRDARINRIFEGSTEIMRLFIAREAMDPHLKIAGEAMNGRLPWSRRLRSALKAGLFYARWYPKTYFPSMVSTPGMEDELSRHVRYAARTSRKLARKMFHAMVKHGPKLEREQMLLARFVDIGTELFAQVASATRAQALLKLGRDRQDVLALVEHFCKNSRLRIEEAFRGIRKNTDRMGYRLAQSVLAGSSAFLCEGLVRKELEAVASEAPSIKEEVPALLRARA